MTFFILTDNCNDLPVTRQTEVKDFQFINLTAYLDEKQIDLSQPLDFFYSKLRSGSMSRTSQISPAEFENTYKEIIAKGHKEILYIGVSGSLSGTYHSGATAAETVMAEYPDVRIITADTLAASLGQGLIVDKAIALRDEGKSIDDVAAWIEQNKLNVAHWVTVDDLNFLKRGGRVSPGIAWFGTALKIKPVLHMNNDGRLVPVEKKIGRKKALARILEILKKTATDLANGSVYIAHGDCLDEVKEFIDSVTKETDVKKFVINILGPVIGSHAGPGTIAVFFLASQR